jgi:sulfide:quinone oxidoreductase
LLCFEADKSFFMDIKKISPALSVSPQIYPEHMERIAAEGFKTIINNRPDNEIDDQPLFAELAAEAAKYGLVIIDHPIIPGAMTEDDVVRFDNDLKTAKGPVLAFCRTGTRSTILWATNEARHTDVDVILKTAESIGINLSGQRDQLERQRG